jgi:AraC-like DNA-binding protein
MEAQSCASVLQPTAAEETNVQPLRVSAVLARGLLEVAAQHGVTAQALGFDDADSLGNTLTLAELNTLFVRAVRLTGRPALGLQWGQFASERSYGLMNILVSYAPTLRRALALVVQFASLLGDGAQVKVVERLGVVRIVFDLHVEHRAIDHGFIEMLNAGLVRMLLVFGCTQDEIRSVSFEYGRPLHHAAYAAAFAGAEQFAQPFTGVEVAAHTLDRRHLHSDPELLAMGLGLAERTLAQITRPVSFRERVRLLLRSVPYTDGWTMARLSHRLGVCERSLRRKLADEGVTWRALTQELQQDTALSLLQDSSLSLQSVAHALGFSDSSSFHRAFRRWTGVTPNEYRAASAMRSLTSSVTELVP